MFPNRPDLFRRSALLSITALALLAWAPPTHARVTRIIVDTKTSPAFGGQSFGLSNLASSSTCLQKVKMPLQRAFGCEATSSAGLMVIEINTERTKKHVSENNTFAKTGGEFMNENRAFGSKL